MPHLVIPTLVIFVAALAGCGSATTVEPDSGAGGTSAGAGAEGGSGGSGGSGGTGGAGATSATSGDGGTGGTSGAGATSGSGGTSGVGATGGTSGATGGSGGTSGTGGTAGSAGTGGTAGSTGTGGTSGTGGAGGCDSPADCDDGIDCTADGCDTSYCTHVIDLSLCGASQVCDLRTGGCRASTACGGNPDCMDSDPCTRNERCDLAAAACKWDMLDNDGDGHAPETCGGDDFDDADGARYPGAIDVCDGKDNDRDGVSDNEPAASMECLVGAHASVACQSGACRIVACEDDWADCNQNVADGCEVDTSSDAENCGSCGYSCGVCVGGECEHPACTNNDRDLNALVNSYRGDPIRTRIGVNCVGACGGLDDFQCLANCAVEQSNGDLTDACAACLSTEPACRAQCQPCSSLPSCRACTCGLECYQTALACSGSPMVPQCN